MTDVHWLVQAEGAVPAGDHWLQGTERHQLAGLRVVKRRRDWRLGRWAAKRALAAYGAIVGEAVEEGLEIRAAADGAPEAYRHGSLLQSVKIEWPFFPFVKHDVVVCTVVLSTRCPTHGMVAELRKRHGQPHLQTWEVQLYGLPN